MSIANYYKHNNVITVKNLIIVNIVNSYVWLIYLFNTFPIQERFFLLFHYAIIQSVIKKTSVKNVFQRKKSKIIFFSSNIFCSSVKMRRWIATGALRFRYFFDCNGE
jgi:hypothetical protein